MQTEISQGTLTYEFPLEEKIRTLLRLEDLFEKLIYFSRGDSPLEHHTALISLFQIIDITGRADLKLDLLQELEKQRLKLNAYRELPQVNIDSLEKALTENRAVSSALYALQGKPGQHLRDNEWLNTIKNRAAIPGGVCEFDLPSYHYWLNSDAEERRLNLSDWAGPLLDLRSALLVILNVLRVSSEAEQCFAPGGAYQLMLAGRNAQLIRLQVTADPPCIPEISANRYAINIRFLTPNTESKAKRVDSDISFALTLASL